MDSARQQQFSRRAPPSTGFDFTLHMRRLCDDMVARLDQLHHIDMSRVALSFSQTRRTGSTGMFASLTPLVSFRQVCKIFGGGAAVAAGCRRESADGGKCRSVAVERLPVIPGHPVLRVRG